MAGPEEPAGTIVTLLGGGSGPALFASLETASRKGTCRGRKHLPSIHLDVFDIYNKSAHTYIILYIQYEKRTNYRSVHSGMQQSQSTSSQSTDRRASPLLLLFMSHTSCGIDPSSLLSSKRAIRRFSMNFNEFGMTPENLFP